MFFCWLTLHLLNLINVNNLILYFWKHTIVQLLHYYSFWQYRPMLFVTAGTEKLYFDNFITLWRGPTFVHAGTTSWLTVTFNVTESLTCLCLLLWQVKMSAVWKACQAIHCMDSVSNLISSSFNVLRNWNCFKSLIYIYLILQVQIKICGENADKTKQYKTRRLFLSIQFKIQTFVKTTTTTKKTPLSI